MSHVNRVDKNKNAGNDRRWFLGGRNFSIKKTNGIRLFVFLRQLFLIFSLFFISFIQTAHSETASFSGITSNRFFGPYALMGMNTSTNTQAYQTIHSLELAQHLILRASNAYFMLKSHSATPEVEKTIKPLIREISLIIRNLPKDTQHLKTNALLKTLKNIWPELENRMLSAVDESVETNDPLGSVSVDTYAQSVIQTISTCIDTLKDKHGVPTESPLAILNQQTLLIRHISTNYAAIAAESVNVKVALAKQKKSLQKLTITFRKQQSMLFEHYAENSGVLKKLNSAQRSWQLIEKSLTNSSNNQVPFIIAKYSEDIVEDLSDAMFILRN